MARDCALEIAGTAASVTKMLRVILVASFAFTACAFAQGKSAIAAIKLLPKDAAKRLARIEAREGAPWPERWYLLVHDPAAEFGLREYVVADGALTASRTLSQFADGLKPSDVIGGDAVKFDSDAVASLAARFPMANGARFGSVNYELGKYGENDAPAWRATVMNEKGDPLGVLIITAQKGVVERHDGFDNKPVETVAEKPAVSKPPAIKPPAVKPAVAKTAAGDSLKPFLVAKPTPAPPVAKVVQRPTPAPTPRPNALKRFGGGVKKLFGND